MQVGGNVPALATIHDTFVKRTPHTLEVPRIFTESQKD
jgi:hypothetical protein